ncbi:Chemotaxis protein CheD [Chitinispirillum alkaliphilum]|nr:Chemotaxis protein CheD [Chitinispirillum alkaliphilum]
MIKKIVIGISEMALSANPQECLITYSLGSCLGVTVYDTEEKIGGMIHCMLPMASLDKEKSVVKPAMFVDSGVSQLFNDFFSSGATKKNMIVKAAGCSRIMDPEGHFKIGERNFTILRKLLWKNGILLQAQDIGGCISRTLSLDISTGKTFVRSGGVTKEL